MNLLELARTALLEAEQKRVQTGTEETKLTKEGVGQDSSSGAPARRWSVRFPNLNPMEVIFVPEARRAEVAALYPGAAIELLPDPTAREPTAAEETELRALVPAVCAVVGEPDPEGCLAAARTDPEAALECYRRLAAAHRVPMPSTSHDDRHTHTPVMDALNPEI